MLLSKSTWKDISFAFTQAEKEEIAAAVTGTVICPEGWDLDRMKLSVALLDKLTGEVIPPSSDPCLSGGFGAAREDRLLGVLIELLARVDERAGPEDLLAQRRARAVLAEIGIEVPRLRYPDNVYAWWKRRNDGLTGEGSR